MKSLCTKMLTAIFILVCTSGVDAQNAQVQSYVKIGLPELKTSSGDKDFSAKAMAVLVQAVEDVGFYEIMDPDAIASIFDKLGKKYPVFCSDPRCIISVGNTIKADRMLFGSVDQGEKTFGAHLTLIDVMSKQTIDQVQLESDPGVSLEDFLKAIVLRLHGQPDENIDITLKTYFGPKVNNRKEWIISSGVCLGAGLIWAIGNGGLESASESRSFDDELSGVVSRAYHIPVHARPAALANAYTAASDDAYGVFYNPAGMAWVKGREAVVTYQKRIGTDNIAASLVNKATREIGFGQGFLYNGDELYSEATFVSAFAYRFNRTVSFLRPFGVGVNVKLTSTRSNESKDKTFDLYSEDNQQGQGFGLGFDLGARAEITENIAGGIVLKDVSSFVREKNMAGDYSYTEFNPMVLLTGGTIRVRHLTNLFAEIQVPVYQDQNWEMAGAIEQIFFRYVKARFGLRRNIQDIERPPWVITGGLGILVPTETLFGKYLTVDAAYEFNQVASLSNSLNFSLLFGF